MSIFTNKSKESKSNAAANENIGTQTASGGGGASFVDNRPEVSTQRNMQATANGRNAAAKTSGGENEIIETEKVSTSVTHEVGEHLSLREGFRTEVYLDSVGKPTAGTGHLLSRAERSKYPVGTTVPNSVLEQWRIDDSENAYAAAYQMAIDIGYETQDLVNALTAVNFQLGTAWGDIHKNTYKHLLNQDWEKTAHEAADSTWFKQTPVRVIDFQRALLNIAGKPTDYDSMVEFNKDAIAKRGVVMPGADNVNAFVPQTYAAGPGISYEDAETTTETTGGETTGGETETATPTVSSAPLVLSGAVGLDKNGNYTGSNTDIKLVQQQLINAGFLPVETMSRSGKMVSSADGYLGPNTIDAIKSFQAQIMGWSKQDGRIDAGGKTWGKLATYTSVAEVEIKEEETSGPSTETPTTTPEPQVEETKEDDSKSDANETEGGQVTGPTNTQTQATSTFEDVPATFATKYKINKSVGGGGANTANDMEKVKSLLRMCGYKTELLNNTGSNSSKRAKRLLQLKNSIFHFQSVHDLTADSKVDAGYGTWKQMITTAYQNSGGADMSESQLDELNNKRKGNSSDVPSDIKANITNGHLLGMDNSGYLLPKELHGGARQIKTALETIKGELGNFEISNGYRSPEHNVKIGSTASKSQHIQGIAADIQTPSGQTPNTLRTKILQLMDQGKIPKGGVGLYGWGVHYDVRGTKTTW